MSTQFVANLLSHKTAPGVVGAGVSCGVAFDFHTVLGETGHIVAILSGLASIAWVVYQYLQSRKPK
jgi:hypothetical protein